jgi:hypothetical protein
MIKENAFHFLFDKQLSNGKDGHTVRLVKKKEEHRLSHSRTEI